VYGLAAGLIAVAACIGALVVYIVKTTDPIGAKGLVGRYIRRQNKAAGLSERTGASNPERITTPAVGGAEGEGGVADPVYGDPIWYKGQYVWPDEDTVDLYDYLYISHEHRAKEERDAG